VLFNN